MGFRLDPQLVADVQGRTDNVTRVVEEGLRWWLARERRKAAKAGADPLARHPAPPAAWEIASRHKDDAT
jgi:hypothetical protein